MATAAPPGVPTLRAALHEAQRLGAEIAAKSGEVIVRHGTTRLTINARRKDATRELVALLADLRADPPPDTPPPYSVPHRPSQPLLDGNGAAAPKPASTRVDRVREHLRETSPPDVNGWRRYNSGAIAKALGLESATQVSIPVNWLLQKGEVEVRRGGNQSDRAHITHIRFVDERPAHAPASPGDYKSPTAPAPKTNGATPVPVGPVRSEPGVPAQPPVKMTPAPPGTLSTPALEQFAAARQIMRTNPLLSVEPDAQQMREILSDALRLFWWVRQGGNR